MAATIAPTSRAGPHRDRDRRGAGLRHRPSCDHGGLPRGARPADRARAASSDPLDLGTGTGVLAIALAKTLRRPVLATDIDPVAVRVARGECGAATTSAAWCERSRRPASRIRRSARARPTISSSPTSSPSRCCGLRRSSSPLVAPGGMLVLSGLLPQQRERVVAAYGAQGMRLAAAAASSTAGRCSSFAKPLTHARARVPTRNRSC